MLRKCKISFIAKSKTQRYLQGIPKPNTNYLRLFRIVFPNGSRSEESACNAGDTRDMGTIPGLVRSPGEENGNSLQYSCLEDPMDRGAWRARVHRITKSWTGLKRLQASIKQ